ncbi:hypothetical protein PVK06_011936 [Gossypium arboreum]|uniref:Uncharacterized protein n=1 Tax=Gossypium arboreum TaxID=29729 RepID=A0ABR0QAK6_GOSAR|nr:hypothetical protein PVK06_011936 [Gossypium arboreum]
MSAALIMSTNEVNFASSATSIHPPSQVVADSVFSHVVQSYSLHDIVKLKEETFLQWQHQMKLIIEAYDVTSFVLGTVAIPPRFVPNSKGKYINSTRVWSKASQLFVAASGIKISRIKHELHALKNGNLTVTKYLAKIKHICDLLATSSHLLTDSEQVDVVLARLSIKFNAVVMMTAFVLEPIRLEGLVEVLLDCEHRQKQLALDSPI